MSENRVNVLENITLAQTDTESIVRAAVSPFFFKGPEEKVVGERGEKSPVRGP